MSPVYIGTSGWSYKGWEKTFYPRDVPVSRHFNYYATRFPTVEINLTFYRLPTPAMVKGWHDKAPSGFVYAAKGSRFITHMKKLANLNGALDRYFERIDPLGDRLGPILWQLPPILRKDLPRLDDFLAHLPDHHEYAVEFRHPSWVEDDDTYALLRRHGIAHASVSSLAMPRNLEVTAEFVYIRFHGLAGGAAHDYTRKEMQPWADHIQRQAARGRTAFVYFNNDANVRAPGNARTLMKMVGAPAVRAFKETEALIHT